MAKYSLQVNGTSDPDNSKSLIRVREQIDIRKTSWLDLKTNLPKQTAKASKIRVKATKRIIKSAMN